MDKLPTLKAVFYQNKGQVQELKNKYAFIWESDKIKFESKAQIARIIGKEMSYWHEKNKNESAKLFNLEQEVRIEFYRNNYLQFIFAQKKLPNDFIRIVTNRNFYKIGHDYFTLKEHAEDRNRFIITSGENATKLTSFNPTKIFDTIQYQTQQPDKLATPVLYTGMTN